MRAFRLVTFRTVVPTRRIQLLYEHSPNDSPNFAALGQILQIGPTDEDEEKLPKSEKARDELVNVMEFHCSYISLLTFNFRQTFLSIIMHLVGPCY